MKTKQIKKTLRKKPKKLKPFTNADLLSTGSTLLNLACTDNARGGFVKGRYILIPGDSSSGKTFVSLTCVAEATNNPEFDKYLLVYDNGEDGALMNMEKLFGSKVVERLVPPRFDKNKEPVYSETVEEFYYNVHDKLDEAAEQKTGIIYILDSENSLTSSYEMGKFETGKKAFEAGKESAGSYGDGKAKMHSEHLRKVLPKLRRTKSILIILCQSRDDLGFGFNKKTRSGGRALKFYCHLEAWTAVVGTLTKTVKGSKRKIGVKCGVKLGKNRFTGKLHEVDIPIYPSYGIDDVGSCVDYLVEEKHWKKVKETIKATDFEFEGTRDSLIKKIEAEDLENDLRDIVQEVWDAIDDACTLKRKPKYQ